MATGYDYSGLAYIEEELGPVISGETNIIVSDSDYKKYGKKICNAYTELADSLENYVDELTIVSENIIVSGESHDALVEFISLFNGLSERIKEIGVEHKKLCSQFIGDIDGIDKEMYEEGCDPRNFTTDRINSFVRAVDDCKGFFGGKLDNWMGNIYENIRYKYYKFTKKINSQKNSFNIRAALLDYLDYDKDDILDIQEKVENKDLEFAGYFAGLYDQFNELLLIIADANNIVSSAGKFTYTEIHGLTNRLSGVVITNHEVDQAEKVEITPENADEFCSNKENLTFYEEYSDILQDAKKDMDFSDALIASTSSAVSAAYAEYFERHSIPPELSGVEVYDYLLIKESLAETIAKTANNEVDISEFLADQEKLKDFLKKLKAGDVGNGNDFYGPLMDAVDNALKVNGYTMDAMEIILPVLWDYSKNLEVIKALANGTDPDSLTALAVQDLMNEYQNTYLLGIDELVDKIMKKLVNKGADALKDVVWSCISNASGLKAATFAISQVAELSGIKEVGQNTYRFDCLLRQNEQLEKAYEHNFNIVASGNYTEQDVINLNNSCTILKENYYQEFTLLRKIAGKKGEHDKKRYYDYLAESIKTTNAMELSNFQPMSYEEYMSEFE